ARVREIPRTSLNQPLSLSLSLLCVFPGVFLCASRPAAVDEGTTWDWTVRDKTAADGKCLQIPPSLHSALYRLSTCLSVPVCVLDVQGLASSLAASLSVSFNYSASMVMVRKYLT